MMNYENLVNLGKAHPRVLPTHFKVDNLCKEPHRVFDLLRLGESEKIPAQIAI